jgi:hypothetical protein
VEVTDAGGGVVCSRDVEIACAAPKISGVEFTFPGADDTQLRYLGDPAACFLPAFNVVFINDQGEQFVDFEGNFFIEVSSEEFDFVYSVDVDDAPPAVNLIALQMTAIDDGMQVFDAAAWAIVPKLTDGASVGADAIPTEGRTFTVFLRVFDCEMVQGGKLEGGGDSFEPTKRAQMGKTGRLEVTVGPGPPVALKLLVDGQDAADASVAVVNGSALEGRGVALGCYDEWGNRTAPLPGQVLLPCTALRCAALHCRPVRHPLSFSLSLTLII